MVVVWMSYILRAIQVEKWRDADQFKDAGKLVTQKS